jgi:hypothetical protein
MAAGMDCSGLNLTFLPNPSDDSSQDAQVDAGGNLIVVDTDCDGFALADLDGSGTEDPDGVIIDFVWSEDGIELATGTVAVVELGEGLHNVTLTITDEFGNETTQEIIVEVVPGSECDADPSPTPAPSPTTSPEPTASPTPMPTASRWMTTGSLNLARDHLTANRLPDGRVLVAGGRFAIIDGVHELTDSCEVWDPETGQWSFTDSFTGPPRFGHEAVLLNSGKVLAIGGQIARTIEPWAATNTEICEIYDPSTDTWTPTGSTIEARSGGSLLLRDGRVLIVGGRPGVPGDFSATCEIYDPATETWSYTGSMNEPRETRGLVQLDDERILVIGGQESPQTTELYDPSTGVWTYTGSLALGRRVAALVVLDDGRVLIAGGRTAPVVPTDRCEIYDPSTGMWSPTGPLLAPNENGIPVKLATGEVLLVAGMLTTETPTATVQRFNPGEGTWSWDESLHVAHGLYGFTPMEDGGFMVVSGWEEIDWPHNNTWTRICEIYMP